MKIWNFKSFGILEDNILKIRILEFWKIYLKIVFRKLDFWNFGKFI